MFSDIDIFFLVGRWNLTALLSYDNRLTLSRKALAQPTTLGSLQSMSMSEFCERVFDFVLGFFYLFLRQKFSFGIT